VTHSDTIVAKDGEFVRSWKHYILNAGKVLSENKHDVKRFKNYFISTECHQTYMQHMIAFVMGNETFGARCWLIQFLI